jgi:hypothetical protein
MILKKLKYIYIYKNKKQIRKKKTNYSFLGFIFYFFKNIYSKKEEDNFKEYIQQKMNSYD